MEIPTQPINVLLVEDNPGDVFLIADALEKNNGSMSYTLHHVEDGEAAMQFLRQDSPYDRVPPPQLILLDLNLPRKHGLEVLTEVKKNPKFKLIPVVVLTTSDAERDILESYRLLANCYITKPFEFDEFVESVKILGNFWLGKVKLPLLSAMD